MQGFKISSAKTVDNSIYMFCRYSLKERWPIQRNTNQCSLDYNHCLCQHPIDNLNVKSRHLCMISSGKNSDNKWWNVTMKCFNHKVHWVTVFSICMCIVIAGWKSWVSFFASVSTTTTNQRIWCIWSANKLTQPQKPVVD